MTRGGFGRLLGHAADSRHGVCRSGPGQRFSAHSGENDPDSATEGFRRTVALSSGFCQGVAGSEQLNDHKGQLSPLMSLYSNALRLGSIAFALVECKIVAQITVEAL